MGVMVIIGSPLVFVSTLRIIDRIVRALKRAARARTP